MPRKTEQIVLKIRYRKPHKIFGVRLVLSGNHKSRRKVNGRVLATRKLSFEEINKVGEFANKAFSFDSELPESLMEDFSKYRQEVKSSA